MKRFVLRYAALCIISVLRLMDRYISGAMAGIPPEEDLQNPYRAFKVLRSRGAILRSYQNRGWLVLGFDEAQQLFRDDRFSNDTRKNAFLSKALRAAAPDGRVQFLDNPTLLQMDAPDHTRLRKLVTHGFNHKYILSLEPRIRQIVRECLDSYDAATGQYDLVTQLAKPLPAIVIAEMMGLPLEDRERFQDMSNRFLGITVLDDEEAMREGNRASDELHQYFVQVTEKKRAHPTQDLIGQLIAAEEEGDRLTGEELYSTCLLMLIAGHETTTRLISNGTYTLLKHPDQLELLKEKPELMANAVEEMLRYEPPVQLMPRYVLDDMEFHGKKLKKNQLIVPVIGSANRDPSANDNPEAFDITRENIRHISFGYGPHLCLGLNLARLEARVAFTALLERFPQMTLAAQDIVWTRVPLVRGMSNLIIDTNETAESENHREAVS